MCKYTKVGDLAHKSSSDLRQGYKSECGLEVVGLLSIRGEGGVSVEYPPKGKCMKCRKIIEIINPIKNEK